MEDIPPILAQKIVYFSDHTFMDRLKSISPSLAKMGKKLPDRKFFEQVTTMGELSAHVPVIEIVKIEDQEPKQEEVMEIERKANAADIPNLDKLSLASFSVDFSNVSKPSSNDTDALTAYADALCGELGII